jgi:hypothetical protein
MYLHKITDENFKCGVDAQSSENSLQSRLEITLCFVRDSADSAGCKRNLFWNKIDKTAPIKDIGCWNSPEMVHRKAEKNENLNLNDN